MPELDLNISSKPIKELSNDVEIVYSAMSSKGERFLVKFVNISKAFDLGIMSCIDYNKQILLNNIDTPAFPEHVLTIRDELQNNEVMGLVSQHYDTTLQKYMFSTNISEKEALDIFNQALKGVYSITMMGYLHKNIRPCHFVRCGKYWKLQSIVESQDYQQANGASSVYLWDPKYQAPESLNSKFTDDDLKQMIVWNMGSMLLDLLVGGHKLCTKEVMNKFRDQPFAFEAIGLSKSISGKFAESTKDLLKRLLHHNPNKRMKLKEMFEQICPEIGEHYRNQKMDIIPSNRIPGPPSGSHFASTNQKSTIAMKQIAQTFAQRQKNKNDMFLSKINQIQDEDDFYGDLVKISSIDTLNSKQEETQAIDKLMENKYNPTREALQLYKSYFDQSELLIIASTIIDKLEFINIKVAKDVKEIKLLIKYAVTFVSLINLHVLAEGFNQNKNIFNLEADLFTEFQESREYSAFKDFVNFRRTQRAKSLDGIRMQISQIKNKYFCKQNPNISDFLTCNYKTTPFASIKSVYRLIVKHAYDSISVQYNEQKRSDVSDFLSRIAMYVTYCLTIEKLYIKEDISDNFRFYFKWLRTEPTNYVPLLQFKKYIEQAPKETLIENARYILRKYYNL